jgi:hypothetical protein
MSEAKPSKIPMQPKLQLVKRKADDHTDPSILRRYQQMMGALMYAVTSTRPDLAYTACYLARFSHAPGPEHLAALKQVYHYLVGTCDYGIVLDGKPDLSLVAYSDSDWNNDINNCVSVTGFVITLCGSPIKWSSRKQTCVTLSSTDAVYLAVTETGRFVRAFRLLLVDLGFRLDGPALTINPPSNVRSKLHFRKAHAIVISTTITTGADEMDLECIPTADHPANLLTKALPFPKMSEFRDAFSVIQLSTC